MDYFEILLCIFCLLFLLPYFFHDKNRLLTNWPLLGMTPALLKNTHRIHDYYTEIIQKSSLTFHFKGPWLTNTSLLATVDPVNVHHIFSKNFGNYPKGPKLKEILDVLGNGIFNTDSDLWQYHRKLAQSFLAHPRLNKFLVNKLWEKVDTGLVPVLDSVSQHGSEVDLQDLFERFTFDMITTIMMDYDPTTLCIDLPRLPSSKALTHVEETVVYRHVLPPFVWKLQRWLDIGQERRYREGWEALDNFVYECLSKKKEEMRNIVSKDTNNNTLQTEVGVDLITLYMEEAKKNTANRNNADKFLRDTFLNFLIAGRDTSSIALSWFFYLLSKNPLVVSQIREELHQLHHNDGTKGNPLKYFSENTEEFNNKLVYLHAALCEALRLYPPVAFQAKVPVEAEVLPSGHRVDPNTQIIISLYAMGRMRSIWGEDCCEFKPERWISERGRIKHEASYKFLAFNAGPRTCVGKNMAFTQMKVVAATLITNYKFEPVKGHEIIPDVSIILRMKHGFKVKVFPVSK